MPLNVAKGTTRIFYLGEKNGALDFGAFHEVNVHHTDDDVKRTKREDPKQPTFENGIGRIGGRTTQNESGTRMTKEKFTDQSINVVCFRSSTT